MKYWYLPAGIALAAFVSLAIIIINRYGLHSSQELRREAASPQPSVSEAKDHKVLVCHIPPGNPEQSHPIEISLQAWESGHNIHQDHDQDFLVDQDHHCPPVPIPSMTPAPCTYPASCDSRTVSVDTFFSNDQPGLRDCNIDYFEATLYINNYQCYFKLTPDLDPLINQFPCDPRIPVSADGAFDNSHDSVLNLSEVLIPINNFNCNPQP